MGYAMAVPVKQRVIASVDGRVADLRADAVAIFSLATGYGIPRYRLYGIDAAPELALLVHVPPDGTFRMVC